MNNGGAAIKKALVRPDKWNSPCHGINNLLGHRSDIRIPFVWGILLEQDAKQLIRRSGNNQQNGASHANHKHPTQDMS